MTQSSNLAFPKPEWPPIQDLESIDITGKRKDGGVDLVIVASQPLDDSAETLDSIRQKVAGYLNVIDLPEFQAEMEYPPRERTRIILNCKYPIHPRAAAVIAECQVSAHVSGVQLTVQRT